MTKYCETKLIALSGKTKKKNKRHHVLSVAKAYEKSLEKICKKVWILEKSFNERFIFGKYQDSTDDVIVTIASWNKDIAGYMNTEMMGC